MEPGGRLLNQSKAFEQVKGLSFESTDKQSGHDGVIIYYITSLGLEVIDVLVRRTLVIIHITQVA